MKLCPNLSKLKLTLSSLWDDWGDHANTFYRLRATLYSFRNLNLPRVKVVIHKMANMNTLAAILEGVAVWEGKFCGQKVAQIMAD